MRQFVSALLVLVSVATFGIEASAKPYFDEKVVDLTLLLPDPPAPSSEQGKADLNDVLSLQKARTPEQVKRVKDDATEEVWRFSDTIENPKFKKENLPKFSAFMDRLLDTTDAVVRPSKGHWNRERPFKVSAAVKPIVEKPNSGSYPSGHSTEGTTMGLVLARMLPEKRAKILARAWEYGSNRVVAGVHFKSDVEAGRVVATSVVAVLMTRDDFKAEYTAAEKELRGALGLK